MNNLYSLARTTFMLVLPVLLISCQAPFGIDDKVPTREPGLDLVIPSARQDVEEAYVLAAKWSQDSILISVDVVVPSDQEIPFVTFTFISRIKPQELLIISYKRDKVTSRSFEWNGSYDTHKKIDPDDWILDSREAFEIAQSNGGYQHTVDAGGNITINLLLQISSDVLSWRVSYRSIDGSGTKYIVVNATTGDVLATK